MEITTGTGLGAILSAIGLSWINNIASKLFTPNPILSACKITLFEKLLNRLNYFLTLSCDHFMTRVTAKTNWSSEGNQDLDGGAPTSLNYAESRSSAPINCVSALTNTIFVQEPQTEISAGQHLIEEIQEQAVSVTRKNDRLFQRGLTPDPNLSSNQVVTVTPSKTQMVDFTTTSPNSTNTSTWPLPTPFDAGFSHNITASCQNFMSEMLSNTTFRQCSPISMLLQIGSALLGLRSYQTLYTVSCLRTSDPVFKPNQNGHSLGPDKTISSIGRPEDSYCFANAITNTTNPSNSFIYYLPLNVSLVGSAVPTCNTCLQSTMSVFQIATANRSSVLAHNYHQAASQVNVVCGPDFVNASLAAAVSSASFKGTKRCSLLVLFWILICFVMMR